MSKVLITRAQIGVGKASGKPYAHVSYVDVETGEVGSGFCDPKVLDGVEAVDLKELESLSVEVHFDSRARVSEVVSR